MIEPRHTETLTGPAEEDMAVRAIYRLKFFVVLRENLGREYRMTQTKLWNCISRSATEAIASVVLLWLVCFYEAIRSASWLKM